ncbi:MAG TPA: CBS and ACT domain-containing protein [Ignavibacteriaceae bacterium]|nr:CBS and ACT domain-containing protein [Ignavibacteriaceae bacterium]
MLISEVMKKNPVTVNFDIKLNEAYKLMQDKKIRHLPVLKEEKLIGVVTDRDLRLATSKLSEHPFDPETEVEKVMSHPVSTTSPNDPVERATQVMRELKIGCLPVVEEMKLVGIVTNTDLLDALLMLTGVHQPSGRLDVRLPNKTGELARLTGLLSEQKVNIHSILTYPDKDGKVRLVLRLGSMEMKMLAELICNAGFEVIWPVHIACVK